MSVNRLPGTGTAASVAPVGAQAMARRSQTAGADRINQQRAHAEKCVADWVSSQGGSLPELTSIDGRERNSS
jgi:hypothetical protein